MLISHFGKTNPKCIHKRGLAGVELTDDNHGGRLIG